MDGMFKTSPPSFLKYLGIGVLCIHHVPITKPFAVFLLLGVKGTMVSLDAFHPSRQAFAQMPLAPHKGLVKTLRTTFTSVMGGLNQLEGCNLRGAYIINPSNAVFLRAKAAIPLKKSVLFWFFPKYEKLTHHSGNIVFFWDMLCWWLSEVFWAVQFYNNWDWGPPRVWRFQGWGQRIGATDSLNATLL